MLKHIRRWNIWKKHCKNNFIHKLRVLFGFIQSPTFGLALLPEEMDEISEAWERSLKND